MSICEAIFTSGILVCKMNYANPKIAEVAANLKKRFDGLENKQDIFKSPELKSLYADIPTLAAEDRASFGQQINALKQNLEAMVAKAEETSEVVETLDVTAPFDVNATEMPVLLSTELGGRHPLMTELDEILDIFYRMGFDAVESRQIDDDYHMFGSLNFPEGHPARDDYDTFMTEEGLIAPAHTSTMQNRVLKERKKQLESGEPIAVVVPGRVFRNEDLDARHEHTFYQLEGIYVNKGVHVGHLMATLKEFMKAYYKRDVEIKTQPFYFPFTEPSFEFAISCPFCDKVGCNICGEGWIELLGCGMIHPNVLKEAGIDPNVYTGFAWGVGFMRMAMIKYNIEDIRHFESAKLEFLRQFK
jgi:phenylalanyl-tRNA synthetase alpha chain